VVRGIGAVALLLGLMPVAAAAQAAGAGGMEVLGVRAQGMGGAFVAVADDATAVYWNPAGLATGDFLSATLERTHVTLPDDPAGAAPVLRTGGLFVGTPPLGVGYYRLGTTHVVPVAVVQSVGDYVNVGAAAKGIWGEGIDGRTHGAFDVDVGVMLRTATWRAGLVLRNLAEPQLGPEVIAFGGNRYRLERHARAGVAVFPRDGLTIAADADLVALEAAGARRRAVAIGAEQRAGARLVVRGGLRAQTIDGARPAVSGGASLEVRPSIWLDAQGTGGADDADRGWSLGLRFRF
jgi:hypothetical protein